MDKYNECVEELKNKLKELNCPLISDYDDDGVKCWIEHDALKHSDTHTRLLNWLVSCLFEDEILLPGETLASVSEMPNRKGRTFSHHMNRFSSLSIVPRKDLEAILKGTAATNQQLHFFVYVLSIISDVRCETPSNDTRVDESLLLTTLVEDSSTLSKVQEVSFAKFIETTAKKCVPGQILKKVLKESARPKQFPAITDLDSAADTLTMEIIMTGTAIERLPDVNPLDVASVGEFGDAAQNFRATFDQYLTQHNNEFRAACQNVSAAHPSTIGSASFLDTADKLQLLCQKIEDLKTFKNSIQAIGELGETSCVNATNTELLNLTIQGMF